MTKNYWNEFEYNKLKLLLNPKKVENIFAVLNRKKNFDELPPISVELQLTDLCNLNCSWCTDKLFRSRASSTSLHDIQHLFEYFQKNNVGVTIEGGGEPSIHQDFEKIVKFGSQLGISMGLISNGVINYSHLMHFFKWVRISLDASNYEEYFLEKGKNCFDTVLKNLETFSGNRDPESTQLGIGYVLTKRNLSNLHSFAEKMNNLMIDYAYLRPVEESSDLLPELSVLFDLKKWTIDFNKNNRMQILLNINERMIKSNDNLPCVAHSLSCIIQANGDVVLCEKRRNDPIIFGNISEKSFEEIWNSEQRINHTQKLLDPENQRNCNVCRITSFNRCFCDINNIHTKQFI
ncbi:MAG: radical SAM protein [Candidatus Riflebacteria bacterium]|nr:radical SAM protein [Candidatus Riflebacteria bacterium]